MTRFFNHGILGIHERKRAEQTTDYLQGGSQTCESAVMKSITIAAVGLGVFLGSGLRTAICQEVRDPVAPRESTGERKVYTIDELKKVRDQVDGTEVAVKGIVYKPKHSNSTQVWLCPGELEDFKGLDKKKALYIPDFPFVLEEEAATKAVIMVGRFGKLGDTWGYDALSPIRASLFRREGCSSSDRGEKNSQA
ncbi:MAG: hypothetical protein EOP88_15920 [Verrucomicrobiaceae bacterium]|nr:MAG: hypothetical protein EOP88_15920 [Verrucomicrobiaceae bacterium]